MAAAGRRGPRSSTGRAGSPDKDLADDKSEVSNTASGSTNNVRSRNAKKKSENASVSSKTSQSTSNSGEKASSSSSNSKSEKSDRSEKREKRKKMAMTLGTNLVVLAIMAYGGLVGRTFYRICYPLFPAEDQFGEPLTFMQNELQPGTKLGAVVHVFDEGKGGRVGSKVTAKALESATWRFDFEYLWDAPGSSQSKMDIPVSVPEKLLRQVKKKVVRLTVAERDAEDNLGRIVAAAEGALIKYIEKKDEPRKWNLLWSQDNEQKQAELCPVKNEPTYVQKKRDRYGNPETKEFRVRGLPKMQLRLVYDEDQYPYYYIGGNPSTQSFPPEAYADEFWLTDDQLTVFDADSDMAARNSTESAAGKDKDTTDKNEKMLHFTTSLHFDLMSSARWRFQRTMEHNLKETAKTFGEDSEEMLQMRDLFANTSATLLITTLIVSVLHMVFEFLAFKNDVQFWNAQSPETLNKYVSVRSVLINILFESILLLYLWDQSTNLIVVAFSLISILIECWKVTRAMKASYWLFMGFIPLPKLETKGVKSDKEEDNYDLVAMKYLSVVVVPAVLAYAGYNLRFHCHKSWYSYILETSASCVYAGGFVLMTPQLFINYKFKSVAYLPWRRFVYRALNTFIDDLFSFIIRMPTMHRLSCFRDDVVFVIYLYQRWIYPEDKTRAFDDDGAPIDVDEEESKKQK